MKNLIFNYFFLLTLMLGLAGVNYSQTRLELLEQANNFIKTARQCLRSCNFGCYNEAINNYEKIRTKHPNLGLKFSGESQELKNIEAGCSAVTVTRVRVGGTRGDTKVIDTLSIMIFENKVDNIFLEAESELLKVERMEIKSQIDNLLIEKEKITPENKELVSLQIKEKELINTLDLLNKQIIQNEKDFQKTDSIKFKGAEKLYKLTQKLKVN